MQKYLYQDLYNLEETHFWHVGKRNLSLMLVRKYLKQSNLKILDIGCGTGKNLEILNQFGQAWGVDTSPEALKFCQKRKLTKVKIGKAENIGFSKNSFDLVTMFDVLEHTDEEKTMNEVKRILKPNGYLLLTVPSYQWLWSKWDEVLKHKKRYSKSGVEHLLKKFGFRIIKSSYFFSYLLIPVVIMRLIKQVLNRHDYGSDFSINNKFINPVAKLLNRVEQLIINHASLPFGTSIIVLARKI